MGTPPAQSAAADASGMPDEQTLRQFVERSAGTVGRVDVRIGPLDSRMKLAPCAKAEPFIPAGARMWGRTMIGVRCLQGASWSVAVPVQVIVRGPALVANANVQFGAAASAGDFHIEEVDLTRESGAVVADPALLNGRVMNRPIAAGQTLHADHLRVPQTVAPGDPVRVRLSGEGFAIVAEGVALNGGSDGQPMRVRTENGRILSGTLRERTVEITL
jgi:flagella basal body P-ring formation protein FlgA